MSLSSSVSPEPLRRSVVVCVGLESITGGLYIVYEGGSLALTDRVSNLDP